MALKRFKPALGDCQQAASLQSDAPSPKTLVRLARCQLSTGSTAPALSTLRSVLAIDAKNTAALQLQTKVLELEAHLRNLEGARDRKDWGMARLALDKCMQVIEGEGGDIPIQWRLWRIELEIAKKNWDAASLAAKCVPLPLRTSSSLAHYTFQTYLGNLAPRHSLRRLNAHGVHMSLRFRHTAMPCG